MICVCYREMHGKGRCLGTREMEICGCKGDRADCDFYPEYRKPEIVVKLIEHPGDEAWMEVKRRALVTVGKTPLTPPDEKWKKSILNARHSPIRYLRFAFYIECPYWVSVHLARHIHAQTYIKSQRNDRQSDYDRNGARQDAPVSMIWDMNAEELMTICNKRLCNKAAQETREVAKRMRDAVLAFCPEFAEALVPMCVYHGGVCHEMQPCGGNIK